MIKINLKKSDSSLSLSSLVDRMFTKQHRSYPFDYDPKGLHSGRTVSGKCVESSELTDKKTLISDFCLNICLSQSCNINIIDDLVEKGIFDCKLIFDLEAEAKLYFILKFESEKIKHFSRKLTVNLLGEGASANFNLAISTSKNQMIKIVTEQIHVASNTSSSFNIRSVAVKNSKIICDNFIKINKDLDKIFASENSKVLSLDPSADVVFIPKLEVDSQDVVCKHGATICKLNEDQLFYLQSRGMSKNAAKDFLIKSFLQS